MMKNVRNMYSKKTSNNENHTNTVWIPFGNFPIPDLEHLTITTPTLYIVAPRTLAPLYHCALHCAIAPPTSYRCSLLHPSTAPLHRTNFQKKNIAKKQKNIAKYKDFAMFFYFFAMFFFLKLVRCRGAVQGCNGTMGAASWYSGATRGYIATYWLSTVHTFAGRLPYLSQLCRKNHCLKPNSRKFNLVHFGLEAFSRRQKQ